MQGRKESGNIGNQSVFKINTASKCRRFNQYFDVFLFGKIHFRNEYLQKSKKLNSNLRMYILFCKNLNLLQNFMNPRNPLDPKRIIFEIF